LFWITQHNILTEVTGTVNHVASIYTANRIMHSGKFTLHMTVQTKQPKQNCKAIGHMTSQ